MFRNQSVDVHSFAMVPRADVPRSAFKMESTHKTTFDASRLVPIACLEVLPGDRFNMSMTAFCRMATPILPLMDNLHLDTFWFFVPNRLVWSNWKRFMGERDPDPTSSISYVIPQMVSPVGGYAINSIFDYFGLPTVGQVDGAATVSHNNLPLRAYNLIYNEWFRDQNFFGSNIVPLGDGPDNPVNFALMRRGKRHDYFTSALPWTQKGNPVSLPLTGNAPVKTSPSALVSGAAVPGMLLYNAAIGAAGPAGTTYVDASGNAFQDLPAGVAGGALYPANLFADLSAVTATTINALRQSFQIQKLLERDARGGTRYTEIIRAHFGVLSPDARLQRPEYLGGSSSPINVNPIAQTSGTGLTGGTTPLGELGAYANGISRSGFTASFTEHGYVLGIVSVRADLTYQQGMERMWSRSTRYDFYFPAFAHLGEQAILNKEIYVRGTADDDLVFGYQERWAEYRYWPSRISGLFRSTASGTIDIWHIAQRFTALPTLGAAFIQEDVPVSRIVAVGAGANGKQFLFDSFFTLRAARPMPMYSVPGLVDHF